MNPAQREPLADDLDHVPRTGRRLGGVVHRDGAAERNTAMEAQRADGGLEVVAADVVEVDVYSLWRGVAQHAPATSPSWC